MSVFFFYYSKKTYIIIVANRLSISYYIKIRNNMQNNFTYFRNKAIPKYKQFNYQLASSYSNKCLLRGLKTNYVAASVCVKHLLTQK